MTDTADLPVIFRPLYERDASIPRVQRLMSRKRMTDHSDHVLWDDGKKQWRWRLPDQATSGAPCPIMATVFIGEGQSTITPGRHEAVSFGFDLRRHYPDPMVQRYIVFSAWPKRGAARIEAARRTGLVLPAGESE